MLATAVFIHEFTHTQSGDIAARVGSLVQRGLPEVADDDVVQTRFAQRAGFTEAYISERDLLFEAASTSRGPLDVADRAVRLLEQRRATFFAGPDAVYADAEDLFLTWKARASSPRIAGSSTVVGAG